MVFAALVAACGSKTSASTAKADFIAQADAICTSYDDLASKATKTFKHPSPRRQVAAIENRLVPLLRRESTELARLKPPAADRATIARFLADVNAATDAILLDPESFVTAHGATPLARKAASEAAAYGFAVCGRI